MKTEDELASYLINLGEEVFHLLLAKGAKNVDAEEIMQQLNHAILEKKYTIQTKR